VKYGIIIIIIIIIITDVIVVGYTSDLQTRMMHVILSSRQSRQYTLDIFHPVPESQV
jgi:hypothetical protein